MEYNQSTDLWLHWRISNPFFINPILKRTTSRIRHQDDIFKIYESWLELPFVYEIDLTDFYLTKLKIVFKDSFPSKIIEQKDSPQTIEEQALYHLYQENKQIFNLYKQILEKKNEFNEKMDMFIDCIKDDIKRLLRLKDAIETTYTIESPLRFFLCKIKENKDVKEIHVGDILERDKRYSKTSDFYEHRVWEIKNDLIDLMKTKRLETITFIDNSEKNINDLKKLISEFQKSLKSVTGKKHLELKSSCPIEKELSNRNMIKSFFRLRKHFQ